MNLTGQITMMSLATTDDDSCYRLGCMESWADNYDELATTDDELL